MHSEFRKKKHARNTHKKREIVDTGGAISDSRIEKLSGKRMFLSKTHINRKERIPQGKLWLWLVKAQREQGV